MKIYYIENDKNNDYDTTSGFVIVANNRKEVRQLAKTLHGDEGAITWETAPIDKLGKYSGNEKNPHIVLRAFHAG